MPVCGAHASALRPALYAGSEGSTSDGTQAGCGLAEQGPPLQVCLMCALNMVAMPGGNRLFVGDLEAVAKLHNA